MLWETGYAESIASLPDGFPTPVLHWRWKSPKTLSAQLAEIGVAPGDIKYVGFSHAHPDHIGNGSLFPTATLYIQEAEYDFYIGPKGKPAAPPANWEKLRSNPTVKLKGRLRRVRRRLGDDPVLARPHAGPPVAARATAETGPVLLTGDAVHFRDNWDNRRAPVQNFDREQTVKSIDRLAGIAAQMKAQIWINHDPAQTATLRKSPAYID